jgi:hypothetical protein
VADEASQAGEGPGRLTEISDRLEEAARRLRDGGLEKEEATRLAEECAALASEAAGELERVARWSGPETVPGQEELL